jgi:molybdopterin-guanine dinucleotide biosynthesis protein A
MGRDKAFVDVDGHPMVKRVADVLRSAGAAPVLAIGGDEAALRALGLDWRPDRFPGEGPLGGLLTAFEALAERELVAVLATDLPALTPQVLVRLVEDLGSHDAAMATTDRPEPLCAVWRSTVCEPVLRRAFERGERAVHRAFGGIDVVPVPVAGHLLRNINRPEDLGR